MPDTHTKQTILVVDDIPSNIDVVDGILASEYRVRFALNGQRALEIAQSVPGPDLILLDVMMPGMDGYEVCTRLKSLPATKDIPVIFVTALDETEAETRGLALGAVDYVTKPVNPAILKARVKTHLALYDQNRVLEEKVRQRTAELKDTRLEIIRRLGLAAEYKDNDTGLHIIRISKYASLLAQTIHLTNSQADLIMNAFPMHDIGKIGIPDQILRKPGKLDPDEWEIMKRHTLIGAQIIGFHPSDLLKAAREVALTHHEHWDGSGYPAGLSGEEIPIFGRLCILVDVFDALTSERPYKRIWPIEKAVDWIKQGSGTYFDPRLVPPFIEILPQIIEIRAEFLEPVEKH